MFLIMSCQRKISLFLSPWKLRKHLPNWLAAYLLGTVHYTLFPASSNMIFGLHSEKVKKLHNDTLNGLFSYRCRRQVVEVNSSFIISYKFSNNKRVIDIEGFSLEMFFLLYFCKLNVTWQVILQLLNILRPGSYVSPLAHLLVGWFVSRIT